MQAKYSVLLLVAQLVVAVRAGSVGAGPSGQCPGDYDWLGFGMCVKVKNLVESFDGRLTWAETNDLCKKENGRLISLDRRGTLNTLSQYVHSIPELSSLNLWVGARRDASGWSWLNSEQLPGYSNMWLPGEPQGNSTYIYGQIVPINEPQRHYLRSATADSIAPGYVCEPYP